MVDEDSEEPQEEQSEEREEGKETDGMAVSRTETLQQEYEFMRNYVNFVRKERAVYVKPGRPEQRAWAFDVSRLEALASDYDWPDFGHVAEIQSLQYHLALRDGLDKTDMERDIRDRVITKTVEVCSSASSIVPIDFLQFSHYVRVLAGVDWNSSPGFPYFYESVNNKNFFQVKDGKPSFERVMYVWELIQKRLEEKDSDPIRLFIKPEPHKKKKIAEKRYRLISSVSIVDQLIDQMVFGFQNEAFLENNHYTPVRVGWGWMKGGWRSVPRAGMVACDKSGWDWTVTPWLLNAEFEIRKRLLVGGDVEKWTEMAQMRYHNLFVKNEFVTSGGVVFTLKHPGVMKSGCVNTIVSNSIMQTILHFRVSEELGVPSYGLWAMGDDTLQPNTPFMEAYCSLLSRYCILKQVSRESEFAGMKWDKGFIEPLYKGKHAYNILRVKDKDINVFSLSYNLLYWRSADKDLIRGLMPVPDIGFDRIWDGE